MASGTGIINTSSIESQWEIAGLWQRQRPSWESSQIVCRGTRSITLHGSNTVLRAGLGGVALTAGGDPADVSAEIEKYRTDPASFVKFVVTDDMLDRPQFPAFQEYMLKMLTRAFANGGQSVGITFNGDVVLSGRLVRAGRASRGWRRHVRRMKAEKRR